SLLAVHPPRRLAPRAAAGEPAVSGARGQDDAGDRVAPSHRRVERVLRHPGRRRPRDREHPPRRGALHRRPPRGDDLSSAVLARGRRLHERRREPAHVGHGAPGVLRGPRALPDAARRRARDAPARAGDPEDDQHAGRALRPARPRARAQRVRRRPGRDRPRPAGGRLDARGPRELRPRDRPRARERRRRGRRRRPHRGAPREAPRTDVIDLRSDFCAPPTEEMWAAMREADESATAELERRGADLLGKEAAVLCPSCSAANLVGVLALTRPGQRAAIDDSSHIVVNEGGWLTDVARLAPVELGAAADLVCLENTHTRRGGAVLPVAETASLAATAPRSHLDGARLPKAAVALGATPAELA